MIVIFVPRRAPPRNFYADFVLLWRLPVGEVIETAEGSYWAEASGVFCSS